MSFDIKKLDAVEIIFLLLKLETKFYQSLEHEQRTENIFNHNFY